MYIFWVASTVLSFHTSTQMTLDFSCPDLCSLSHFPLHPAAELIFPFLCPTFPPIPILFPLPRDIYPFLLVHYSTPNFCGSIDFTMFIIDVNS